MRRMKNKYLRIKEKTPGLRLTLVKIQIHADFKLLFLRLNQLESAFDKKFCSCTKSIRIF